jgi:hypothetical protein
MQITEEELARRVKHPQDNQTVAGPDHPIYSGGLIQSSFRKLTKSSNDS